MREHADSSEPRKPHAHAWRLLPARFFGGSFQTKCQRRQEFGGAASETVYVPESNMGAFGPSHARFFLGDVHMASATGVVLSPLAVPQPKASTQLDLWMLAGIAIALVATIAGIRSTGVNLVYFLQPTGALIVLGGTWGITLITTPRNALRHCARRITELFRPENVSREALIEEI